MGIDPNGEVFLRTRKRDFTDEVVTVELQGDKRRRNHGPTRNRRLTSVIHGLTDSMTAGTRS